MKFLLLLSITISFSLTSLQSQNLDKVRTLCIDEIDPTNYSGNLSQKELENQVAALGFRYIEDGKVNYHHELIVYDCNTGGVQFTATFDENRLVKTFVLYESEGIPAKKISFSKSNQSPYVDLKLNYKGQTVPAFPEGETKIYSGGKLRQLISFSGNGKAPLISNYDQSNSKISEGKGYISGEILSDWNVRKLGEWSYFDNGQITSKIIYDENGNIKKESTYSGGNLSTEQRFLSSSEIEITQYYSNGERKAKGIKLNDQQNGEWVFYRENGSLSSKIDFSKDTAIQKLFYSVEGKLTVKQSLVQDKDELVKGLAHLKQVYLNQRFFKNQKLKSRGYISFGNQVGIHEYYNEKGELSEITAYSAIGEKMSSIDAGTYRSMQEREKSVYRELLVAKTTHPINLGLLNQIQTLSKSLHIDYDSLMFGYQYQSDFENKYLRLLKETEQFGELTNQMSWYDTLLISATTLNNETWAYSHDLFEVELALEKKLAITNLVQLTDKLTQNFTSTKKTLFGSRLVVKNDQEKIYESIMQEIYPFVKIDISNAKSKFEVYSSIKDFKSLLKKGSAIISNPDRQFEEALKNTSSAQAKKELFLSTK